MRPCWGARARPQVYRGFPETYQEAFEGEGAPLLPSNYTQAVRSFKVAAELPMVGEWARRAMMRGPGRLAAAARGLAACAAPLWSPSPRPALIPC